MLKYGGFIMKKLLAIILCLFLCCGLCACTSGKNVVKINDALPDHVNFYPKCPECKHVNTAKTAFISKGEEYESSVVCEKCSEFFDIEVKR